MPIGHQLLLEGNKYNNWLVVSYFGIKFKKRHFECICINCKHKKIFCGTELVQGKIRCCKKCNENNNNIINKNTLKSGFEKFVIKNTEGCWGWSGCKPINPGYGQFRHSMKLERAHRASWIIHFGEIPKGMFVLHKCDNRECSKPDHLFLGNNMDNIKDMISKKRHATRNNKNGRFQRNVRAN